jgi:hypothetical protein
MSRQTIATIVALGLVLGTLPTYLAHAADEPCPGVRGGQVFPFDGTNVIFDSIALQEQAGQRDIVNCVMIPNATHEYHIDWGEAGINSFTRKGFLMSSRHLGDDPKIEESTAYVGVNRTKFAPGLETEKGFVAKLKEVFETRFFGSVSTVARDQPEPAREAKLRPVDLQFAAQLSEPGRARLEYVDLAAPGNITIGFSLPEDVRKVLASSDLQFRLSADRTAFDYSIGSGEPVAIRIVVLLKNSDFQEIGTVPVTIIIASSGR